MQIKIKRFLVFGLSVCLCAATMTPSIAWANAPGDASKSAKASRLTRDKIANAAPVLTATLDDAFSDPDGNGRAERGTEITYTAKLTNSGTTAADNASLTVALDPYLTFVENSTVVSRHNLPAVVTTNPPNGSTAVPVNAQISIDFNQPVNVGAESFALECPVGAPKSFSVGGSGTSLITLTPSTALPGATNCRVRVVASQIFSVDAHEPMLADYVFAFSTFSRARLRLSEVAPNITSSRDLVELTVLEGGTTNGITLVQDATVLATLPDVTVAAGDVIVLHFNPTAGTDEAPGPETVTKSQYPSATFAANYDAAWDFHAGATGIAYSNRVLRVEDVDGNTQDAVPFVRTSGAPPAAFPSQLQLIQDEGLWLPTNCGGMLCTYASMPTAVDVSVSWEGAATTRTGNSVKRISATDTNTRNDWSISAGTFGFINEFLVNAVDRESRTMSGEFTNAEAGVGVEQAVPPAVNLGSVLPGEVVVVTFRAVVSASLPQSASQVSSQATLAGDNFPSLVTDDQTTPAPNDATVTLISLAPTAARVSVGGRVLSADGRGLSGAVVYLTNADGATAAARTSSFGYFRFENVSVGETYILTVGAKSHRFAPTVVSVNDEISDLNLIAEAG